MTGGATEQLSEENATKCSLRNENLLGSHKLEALVRLCRFPRLQDGVGGATVRAKCNIPVVRCIQLEEKRQSH